MISCLYCNVDLNSEEELSEHMHSIHKIGEASYAEMLQGVMEQAHEWWDRVYVPKGRKSWEDMNIGERKTVINAYIRREQNFLEESLMGLIDEPNVKDIWAQWVSSQHGNDVDDWLSFADKKGVNYYDARYKWVENKLGESNAFGTYKDPELDDLIDKELDQFSEIGAEFYAKEYDLGDCPYCEGSGTDPNSSGVCQFCFGSGKFDRDVKTHGVEGGRGSGKLGHQPWMLGTYMAEVCPNCKVSTERDGNGKCALCGN
mgnify:FL=1